MQQPSAKQNEASNKNTMLRRRKTMSIIFNRLYIRSKGLYDLKTLYYQQDKHRSVLPYLY